MDINTLKAFLMWCTIINFAMLMFSFVVLMIFAGPIHKMHSKMFKISREAFNVAIYCFLGLYKSLWIIFNLVPWVALIIIT